MECPTVFPAICPACGEDGCEDCNYSGRIAVHINYDKIWYTEHCTICGFDNGACQLDFIHYYYYCLKVHVFEEWLTTTEECVQCGGQTIWRKLF